MVVDNYVDILSKSDKRIKRLRIDFHFDPRGGIVQGEGGLCLVIDTFSGKKRMSRVMVDAAFESEVVIHNMKLLGIDPSTIDAVLLSHGHPDHFGGLVGVLESIGHKVPLVVHPDAFIPRSIITNITRADRFNQKLTRSSLRQAGAVLNETNKPVRLGHAIYTTGEVERRLSFERDVPKGRFQVIDGRLVPDEIRDDTNVLVNVRNKGLIVVSPCGHSGVVNTTIYARKIAGVRTIYCVIGGFHLGHPDIPKNKIDKTIDALLRLDARRIVPIHCSGLECKFKTMEKANDRFISAGAATVLNF
ncbi:MAG: MBL fold metallo-hydrolase [Thermofilum sp.]